MTAKMGAVCVFCDARSDLEHDLLFAESPDGTAICSDCVSACTSLFSRKQLTRHKTRCAKP